MINEFPDFHKYEKEYDSILEIEENANVHKAIFAFLKSIKKLITKDNNFQKFNKKEIKEALENYIFKQLHNKIFPFEPSNIDFLLNKKCQRLSFLKPENVIEKKIISPNFMKQGIEIIKNIEKQITPKDMIKCIDNCINFISNCNYFCFGDSSSGVDDISNAFNYIVIKANPKNLNSIYKYCSLFIDEQRGIYGHRLETFGMMIGNIRKAKFNNYYGISDGDYGIDEFDDKGNPLEDH